MTESTSTGINILCIKKKGFFGYPYQENSGGYDEDGVRWWTWYLEPNTDDYTQRMMAFMYSGICFQDILIDEDIADDVADSTVQYLLSRLRGVEAISDQIKEAYEYQYGNNVTTIH